MSLKITAIAYGDTVQLQCMGRIVLGSGSSELRDKVRAVLQSGAKNVVVDLGDVNYMDSSGIGEMVSAYTVTRNSGGDLVLARPSRKVRDLLTITKLITVFTVFETTEEALQHFGPAVASQAAAMDSQGNDEPKV